MVNMKKKKNRRYVIMDGSKELGTVSAHSARSLHRKLIEMLAFEYLKNNNIKIVRCV